MRLRRRATTPGPARNPYKQSSEIKNQILDLYKNGYSIIQITKQLECSIPTVSKIVNNLDYDLHAQTVKQRNLPFIVETTGNYRERKYICNKCGKYTIRNTNNFLQSPNCPFCRPKSQTELDFIATLNNQIGQGLSNQKIPSSNLELDWLYGNIAVEYHGEYWHSELFKNKNYHLKKLKLCEKNNIELIQIFEHEWLKRPTAVLNLIKSKLGKNITSIYARSCKVKPVEDIEKHNFFEQYHIHGDMPSLLALGIYKDGTLLSCISFRKHVEGIELARFATKDSIRVVGGFSKMLNKAKLELKSYKTLITYANRRLSKGKVYDASGFIFNKNTQIDWFWLKNGKVYNRRHSWGKSQNEMYQQNYLKVFGTGHKKYTMDLE